MYKHQKAFNEDQAETLRKIMNGTLSLNELSVEKEAVEVNSTKHPSIVSFLTKLVEDTGENIELNKNYIFMICHNDRGKHDGNYLFYFSTDTMLYPFEPEPRIGALLIQDNNDILKKHDLELILQFKDPGPGQDFIFETISAKPIIPKK